MYHAAEGALLLQAIIQRFPPQFMEAYLPNIVTTVLARQTKVPMCKSFERILFSVIFSALISNADLTLQTLNVPIDSSTDVLWIGRFFSRIQALRTTYVEKWEMKLVILGLNSILQANFIPDFLQRNLKLLFTLVIQFMNRQKRFEREYHMKIGKKEI